MQRASTSAGALFDVEMLDTQHRRSREDFLAAQGDPVFSDDGSQSGRRTMTRSRLVAFSVICLLVIIPHLAGGYVSAASAAGSSFATGIIHPESGDGLMLVSCASTVRSHC